MAAWNGTQMQHGRTVQYDVTKRLCTHAMYTCAALYCAHSFLPHGALALLCSSQVSVAVWKSNAVRHSFTVQRTLSPECINVQREQHFTG